MQVDRVEVVVRCVLADQIGGDGMAVPDDDAVVVQHGQRVLRIQLCVCEKEHK